MNACKWTLVLLSFAVSACQVKAGKNLNSDDATVSYNLSENGCKTGKREFKGSRDSANGQLCAALQNDGLNCFCAGNLRKRHFESVGCGGKFTATAGQMNADCAAINSNGRGTVTGGGGSPYSSAPTASRETLPTDGSPCPPNLTAELDWLANLKGFNYFSIQYRCPRIAELGAFRCTVKGKMWTLSEAANICLQHMN